MFPFQLLRSPLAHLTLSRIQMPLVGTPAVGVKAANAKRCEQPFEFQKRPVFTATKNIGQDPARVMIQRLPQPAWLFLTANK